MNHDVFISYSSKNTTTALAMCHVLEQHCIKCWMAPRDIPPGYDYADVIDEAIIACRVFVIIFSEPASVSKWVKRELSLAASEEKHIIPYRIDDTRLKGSLRLILNPTHWIEAYPDAESKFDELVTGIARYLGIPADADQPQTDSSTVAADTAAVQSSAMKPNKTYKVGDYYNENGREGVVFEVDATGRHGKIVGMKQAKYPWCKYEASEVTGATEKTDGLVNMRLIMRIDNWREIYPAFAWCAEQGEGWYLPAIDELEKVMLDNKVCEAVNQTLSKYGGDTLINVQMASWYWSSSEFNKKCVMLLNVHCGYTELGNKNYTDYVRAVSTF